MSEKADASVTSAPAVAEKGRGGRGGAALVSIGILASRFVGLARQKVIAHYLGTGEAADAVAAAFRVGNIAQNLLGEGTLSASFVPIYAKLRLEGDARAARFARAALGALLVLVVTLSVVGALFAPALTGLIAAGFHGHKRAFTAELVRILFPMTGILVLSAWSLGVLTAHRRFLLPYIAPVVWSVAQIVAVVAAAHLAGRGEEDLARAVTWGACAGAVLQLGLMLVPVRRLVGSVAPVLDLHTEGLRDAMVRFPTALAARGVIQISGLIDLAIVSFLGPGANATFQFAQTLYLLPMSVLGTGEAAASLPDLSEQSVDSPEARHRIVKGLTTLLSRVFVLSLAAAAMFLFFGVEVTTLPLRGGKFTGSSTQDVAAVLSAYALGLPANAASRILGTALFARGDTRRPALYALVRVIVSTGVSLALMRRFGVPGVVVGAAVAAWVELVLIARGVLRTYGATGLSGVPFVRVVLAAAAPVAVGLPVQALLARTSVGPFLSSAIVLAVAGGTFLVAAELTKTLSVRSLLRRRR